MQLFCTQAYAVSCVQVYEGIEPWAQAPLPGPESGPTGDAQCLGLGLPWYPQLLLAGAWDMGSPEMAPAHEDLQPSWCPSESAQSEHKILLHTICLMFLKKKINAV